MKVYKFGGASIKDAASVKNIAIVLKTVGYKNILMVVSAMGKTTNSLENLVQIYFLQQDIDSSITKITQDHQRITTILFPSNHSIFKEIDIFFSDIKVFFKSNKSENYNFVYDQIVSFGELISTKIVSEYLWLKGIENEWLDVRNYIKTDTNYRQANVDWQETVKRIGALKKDIFYITQGFIGSDFNGFTTTLGREGSDYTAAIFSWCLNVESQTIWKDVPGVLNADPRYFSDTKLLQQLSYEEAIELAYYGASIIHPKTLHPLQDKSIPLYVRSFLNLKQPGTSVKKGPILLPFLPCYILKKNQILLSFSRQDFTFITEYNISEIFNFFSEFSIKVNLIQSSAISFSVCIEDAFNQLNFLLEKWKSQYKMKVFRNISLYTLRHYDTESMIKILSNKNVLLRQVTTDTAQLVVEE